MYGPGDDSDAEEEKVSWYNLISTDEDDEWADEVIDDDED